MHGLCRLLQHYRHFSEAPPVATDVRLLAGTGPVGLLRSRAAFDPDRSPTPQSVKVPQVQVAALPSLKEAPGMAEENMLDIALPQSQRRMWSAQVVAAGVILLTRASLKWVDRV